MTHTTQDSIDEIKAIREADRREELFRQQTEALRRKLMGVHIVQIEHLYGNTYKATLSNGLTFEFYEESLDD